MDRQTIWWFISILIFGLAAYLFITFKPILTPSLSAFIFGFLGGGLTYLTSKLIRFVIHKQIVNPTVIFVNAVLLAPITEEILFRFGIITVLFNNSLTGVVVSILTWVILHLIYSTLVSPIGYFKTLKGIIDVTISGVVLSSVYVLSDFNLFVPWVAHTLHNLLVWLSAFPRVIRLAPQSKGTVAILQFLNVFSRFSPKHNFYWCLFKALTGVRK